MLFFNITSFPVINFLDINLGIIRSTIFILIILLTPPLISITITITITIGHRIFIRYIKKGSDNFLNRNKPHVTISSIQFAAPYSIFFLYFPFQIIDLIIWIITLSLLIIPLYQGVSANIKVNYYCYESSQKIVINAMTSEEIMVIAIFSFNLAAIFGLNIIPLLLLIYLKYPVKYIFFTKRKYHDFYKNLNLFYKIIFYFIIVPLIILNIIFSSIYFFEWIFYLTQL